MTKKELQQSLKVIKYVGMFEKPKYDQAITFTSDFCVVTADWHIPYMSWKWVDKVLYMGKQHKGKKDLAIGGDFFNLDAFSKWELNDENDSLTSELETAKYVLSELLKVFDRIFISVGNHDNRILYSSKGKLNYNILFSAILDDKSVLGKKLFVSQYPYLLLNNKWRITHPDQYSVVKTTVARNLNNKFRQNIINAHGHFLSLTKGTSGDDVVGDIGCIVDPKKVHYINLKDTAHPMWNNGFWIVRENKPYIFGDDSITDWKFWEGVKNF